MHFIDFLEGVLKGTYTVRSNDLLQCTTGMRQVLISMNRMDQSAVVVVSEFLELLYNAYELNSGCYEKVAKTYYIYILERI